MKRSAGAAIVAAAHQAFVELGFARTTTAVVAARAKISKRSIYELFADRTRPVRRRHPASAAT